MNLELNIQCQWTGIKFGAKFFLTVKFSTKDRDNQWLLLQSYRNFITDLAKIVYKQKKSWLIKTY